MESLHKSSSHIQTQAEDIIFKKVNKIINAKFDRNKKIYLTDDTRIHIEPDFYSADDAIIGEIFAHIGKPQKAQNNKIANDILKMLLLEKITGRSYRKIIVVCDIAEKEELEGKSALAESIRQFGIELLYVELDEEMRNQILNAQELQKMTNA